MLSVICCGVSCVWRTSRLGRAHSAFGTEAAYPSHLTARATGRYSWTKYCQVSPMLFAAAVSISYPRCPEEISTFNIRAELDRPSIVYRVEGGPVSYSLGRDSIPSVVDVSINLTLNNGVEMPALGFGVFQPHPKPPPHLLLRRFVSATASSIAGRLSTIRSSPISPRRTERLLPK